MTEQTHAMKRDEFEQHFNCFSPEVMELIWQSFDFRLPIEERRKLGAQARELREAETKVRRVGDWIQTFTGRQFYPLDPRPEEIDIRDIAHSLSMQCRYAGHSLRFYSTAEHSWLLSHTVSRPNALAALLHDGGEAYLPDMVRPLKRSFPDYTKAEERIREMLFFKHGLMTTLPDEVREHDDRICADEKAQNMAPCDWKHNPEPLNIKLRFWAPGTAEAMFLGRYSALTGMPIRELT